MSRLTPLSPASALPTCYHCGQPVPARTDYTVTIDSAPRRMCCRGCQAVAQTVVDSGLADYYRHRTAEAATGHELVPEILREAALYDHPEIQKAFVRERGDQLREASLMLENITCAACVWLSERTLASLPGVREARINYSTHRARVTWDNSRIRLSDILEAIARIGYRAHPYDPNQRQALLEAERKRRLRQIGIAAIFGLQVMTLAEALYFSDWWGLDLELQRLFLWTSFFLTLPVLTYSAAPFFAGAWRDLRHGRAGMDVPIVLGIVTAFLGSVWVTITNSGVAYFDSVTMFVLLLLCARYVEQRARQRAGDSAERLARATPTLATRLNPDGADDSVAAVELRAGDLVRIRPGETVPADGTVVEGQSTVDESLLTGESRPRVRHLHDRLIGGAINRESPLLMRVEKTGSDTTLSAMLHLLERAGAEKPRIAEAAERIAGHFVVAVLLLALVAGLAWWHVDPARVLPVVISVLVVTCPCALALATPAALAAATASLTRRGLLLTRGHALERLARATHFVFDKTGTLTLGEPTLTGVETLTTASRSECLRLASALERHSEHPLARALVVAAPASVLHASHVINTPGEGLTGTIGKDRYAIGTVEFVARETGLALHTRPPTTAPDASGSRVWLANSRHWVAAFYFEDPIRPDAAPTLEKLRQLGARLVMLSGDNEPAARHVAAALGIEEVHGNQRPADKLDAVRRLQADGAVVVMVGDGVNDAPVLAGADVSIAVCGAAHVSVLAADVVQLNSDLTRLPEALAAARRTRRIIRENLAWAVVYNLLTIPAAAMGWVTPWVAALGMSVSSLTVVLNSMRLIRGANG